MYKIYCLIDPRNGRKFYVGKTCNSLQKRLYQHTKSTCNIRLRKYIAKIIKAGFYPEIKLLEDKILCRHSYEREVFWIKKLNRNGNKTYNIVLIKATGIKMVAPRRRA